MSEWKAAVLTDRNLFLTRQARIMLGRVRQDGFEYILPGGQSYIQGHDQDPHADAPTGGILVPHDALPALAEALVKHLGDSLPSAGEVRVLREWLETERLRVDSALLRARITG